MGRRLRPRRGGFTLVELLLVLAVLVVITGIAWPFVLRFAGEYQLRDGAEAVRVALANTRLRAVDSTQIWQFRFEPGGRRYVALPLERDAVMSDGGPAAAATALEVPPLGTLPEGLQFVVDASAAQAVLSEELADDLLAMVPNSGAASTAKWSPAVRFFPDGSADPVVFSVAAEDGSTVRVGLQALTGAVSLSNVE